MSRRCRWADGDTLGYVTAGTAEPCQPAMDFMNSNLGGRDTLSAMCSLFARVASVRLDQVGPTLFAQEKLVFVEPQKASCVRVSS